MSHFINLGKWLGNKIDLHSKAQTPSVRRALITQGEVWMCDLGFNVGEEKNKKRPVVIISNNRIHRTGKVIVAPITDAKGKMNASDLPQQNTWYLLYSNSTDSNDWFKPSRTLPRLAIAYPFLSKDSVIQCEEVRSVSKARLDSIKLGDLDSGDFSRLKQKIKNVFNL